MLEPAVALGTFGSGNAVVPAQDRRDGARAGHRAAVPGRTLRMVRPPRSGMLLADPEDGLLECRRGPAG